MKALKRSSPGCAHSVDERYARCHDVIRLVIAPQRGPGIFMENYDRFVYLRVLNNCPHESLSIMIINAESESFYRDL